MTFAGLTPVAPACLEVFTFGLGCCSRLGLLDGCEGSGRDRWWRVGLAGGGLGGRAAAFASVSGRLSASGAPLILGLACGVGAGAADVGDDERAGDMSAFGEPSRADRITLFRLKAAAGTAVVQGSIANGAP